MNSGQIFSKDIIVSCMAARGYTDDPSGFGPPEGGAVDIK
jgi:hypothetical protein